MANDDGCWFCGGPAGEPHAFRVGLHRNVVTTNRILWSRDEWERMDLSVPRCRRCRTGHALEVLLLVVGVPGLAWGSALLIDGLTQAPGRPPLSAWIVTQAVAFMLPFAGWLALRFRGPGVGSWLPNPRRYVRRHPAVRDRLDDGWRYGGAPWSHWDKRLSWPD